MSHTPEQASKLWCPMVRIARREEMDSDKGGIVMVGGCNTDALGGNRVPQSCRCIADQCAMWRWEYEEESVETITEGAGGVPARTFKHQQVFKRGYCGLAGRQEAV